MYSVELKVGEKILRLESGRVARQSAGEVLVSYGDTVVLVCVNYSPEVDNSVDFLPLTVEYRELSFAAGKIPGGFIKRETRPSDNEILSSRLIDRPLRPLFPPDFRNEVQIIAYLLSADVEHDADVLGITGAATALLISEIPYTTPVAGVRVGLLDGKYIINPTLSQQDSCKVNLVIAGTKDAVVMIEGGARESSEEEVIGAIKYGHEECKRIIEIEEKMRSAVGKEKLEMNEPFVDEGLANEIKEKVGSDLNQVFLFREKKARQEAIYQLIQNVVEKFAEREIENIELKVKYVVEKMIAEKMRKMILEEKRRFDGRGLKDIRNISCEIGVLPRTHGSALFTRGQTQSLAVTTLGTKSDEQRIDAIYGEETKSFMLHYNFPPFATGEVKPIRGPSRREIGHGALAERAILPVLPSEEVFPYTIRVVSNILESNGSSSMASVCSASLALMDAGVPIKTAVAGISIGLVKEGDRYELLTDIIGDEDHYGDMDFKVAGTKDGITAIQLDLKIQGLDIEILRQALEQAREARESILKIMSSTISSPRTSLSKYAPKILAFSIPKEKIGDVIGPGGKVIRRIIGDSDLKIDITDDGKVTIAGSDPEKVNKAKTEILGIVQEAEVGKIYIGKVTRITNFGAFVEILPGKEGLLHISKLSRQRVRRVEDVVKPGDEVIVRVYEIDEMGRINLMRVGEDWKKHR
ncbi:MAG: polyribonucleotide nucleotidyltransferase [candidate division WOR-3 bacterium]|nr:polyribonucleotide nucleotidyltransferase [candidate division WOR-3 bacterium]